MKPADAPLHNRASLFKQTELPLNIMRKDTSKGSLRVRFNRAAWNNKYLARLLTLA